MFISSLLIKYLANLTYLPLMGILICWGRRFTIHDMTAAFSSCMRYYKCFFPMCKEANEQ